MSACTSRRLLVDAVSAGAWAVHRLIQARRVAASRRTSGVAAMQVSANSGNCCDQGRSARIVRCSSAKNPGRSNVTAPMPATTRPTSAPSSPMAASPNSPSASTWLSSVPATCSTTIVGRVPSSAASAGITSSTCGTGTCRRAFAMTAASRRGPARRTEPRPGRRSVSASTSHARTRRPASRSPPRNCRAPRRFHEPPRDASAQSTTHGDVRRLGGMACGRAVDGDGGAVPRRGHGRCYPDRLHGEAPCRKCRQGVKARCTAAARLVRRRSWSVAGSAVVAV